jgi:hypothetical protein
VLSEKGKEHQTSPSSPPAGQMAGLSLSRSPPPPRPSALSKPSVRSPPARSAASHSESEEEEDENDPFADRNAVVTPSVEKAQPKW